ncbi:5-formyltetrahydrofolate cyclo-ligase [Aeromicrobium sp. 636]|uniref:5-formyltetrahydrofolate cyclo-ligase n=1 Tax=Aeromicrobium senzhongii TaxID=2663859 RepID=A0A8I0K3H5_9ACTN|nr:MULTISPECIES: 5-formyltetrahydrofolate cyclo-ligase [Aeromicrobium]MBC9227545.1 5-formyltetrahydrofolate cyclo-ligase [Aeromicrobium senzhongii]MCQ3999642.1 5-formyltetrahydrofolate cyclo-ligase [Aeromicrobium sp. 636]
MSADVISEKVQLRTSLAAGRRTRSPQDRAAAAEAIALHAAALPALARAARVAAYLSMPSEPGTAPLLQWLQDRQVTVLVPVSHPDRSLTWVEHATDAVRAGSLGVPEPVGADLGPDALATCDIALVPALAVDHGGNRLGRGAGYYDRALAGFDGVVCALVFEDELLPHVPHETHDRPVDLVLTPAGVFRPLRD